MKYQLQLPQIFSKTILIAILLVSLMAIAQARPNHFVAAPASAPDNNNNNNNQLVIDQDGNSNNLDLKPWQKDYLLTQLLADLKYINNGNNNNGVWDGEYAFDRALRGGNDIKRQSRYRLCYFNPVSCFKK